MQTTIYTTVFLYPSESKINWVREGIITASKEPKVNEWHNAIHPDNLAGIGQLVYDNGYIQGYIAYATMGKDVLVPKELHPPILEAIDRTVNMNCDGPYKQVDMGEYIADILWWPLEDE